MGAAAVRRPRGWSSSSRRTCTSPERWCRTTPGRRTLFSSDLFGGFVPGHRRPRVHDLDYIIENAAPVPPALHAEPRTAQRPGSTRDPAALAAHPADRTAARSRDPEPAWCGPPSRPSRRSSAASSPSLTPTWTSSASCASRRRARTSPRRCSPSPSRSRSSPPSTGSSPATHESRDCALFIDLPDDGWTMWGRGQSTPVHRAHPARLAPGRAARQPAGTARDPHGRRRASRRGPARHAAGDGLERAPGRRPVPRTSTARSRRVTEVLAQAAFTDPLTGLGNRRALDARLPVGTYALIAIDLDHFKDVNDPSGTPPATPSSRRGRRVIGTRCAATTPSIRVGGEEFLVCLPDATEARPVAIAERIRAAVARSRPRRLGARRAHHGELAAWPPSTAATRRTFATAPWRGRRALYESKETGRDRDDRPTTADLPPTGGWRLTHRPRVGFASPHGDATGRLAQGLARFLDTEEVTGSIPVSPHFKNPLVIQGVFVFPGPACT